MVTAILNPEVVCLNLFQKEIIPEEIKQNILETEENGMKAYKQFVDERICETDNL